MPQLYGMRGEEEKIHLKINLLGKEHEFKKNYFLNRLRKNNLESVNF